MAEMIPRTIQFKKSPAEVRLFAVLKAGLPNDFTVLHHVRWLQKERRVRDGEADFLVLHPRKGALAIEVKGGLLSHDASSGVWTSTDRSGAVHELARDPVDQAKDSAYSLARYLRGLPNWPARWGPIGYAVCIPDGRLRGESPAHLGPILLDEGHMKVAPGLQGRVEEILDYWREDRHETTPEGVDKVIRALARDIKVQHPLAFDLDEADREFIRLSQEQFRVLDMLAGNRRVSVSGPAGSGKTLIAAEKARRLASEGLRVLFTCFNRPLAENLKDALSDVEGIDVYGFHQLSLLATKEARIDVWGSRADPEFWDHTLPEAFARAAEKIGPRYDALIVDEAQDFSEDWWLPLLMLLEDPDGGIFYIFYDDNQAIYRKPGGLPDGMVQVRLSEDWRNTTPIFDAVMAFYKGDSVVCAGPDGPPVEMRSVLQANLRTELSRVLHRLVIEGDVAASDLVILTPHSVNHSQVLGHLGAFNLTGDPSARQDIRVESIHRFKGLEAKVAVICEVSRFVEEDFTRLMYVACSRARTYLVVLLTEETERTN